MKKGVLKLMTVIAALTAASCQNHSDTGFTVTGEIENVDDGYLMLFFKSNIDGSTTTIAVDTLKNGRFEFKAPAAQKKVI